MGVIDLHLASNNITTTTTTATQTQQAVADEGFSHHQHDDPIYKTPTVVEAAADEQKQQQHQHQQQQQDHHQYEEDFSSSASSSSSSSSSAASVVSSSAAPEPSSSQNKKTSSTEEEDASTTSEVEAEAKAEDDDNNNHRHHYGDDKHARQTKAAEYVPNVWHQQKLISKEVSKGQQQLLDYQEHGDNDTPRSQQSSEENQSTATVESLAVTESNNSSSFDNSNNNPSSAAAPSRLMQSSGEQKRTTKRARRSSDHHKRAAVSNHNRKLHTNMNSNKASNNNNNNNNATLAAAKSNNSSCNDTNTKQQQQQQQQQQEDRVVRSDEIALFMRCKKRYSDPDFKPIPPLPGGWDEVTPDRVITWEQTADMLDDFSSYKQSDPDWNNRLPWSRDHRHTTTTTTTTATATTTETTPSSTTATTKDKPLSITGKTVFADGIHNTKVNCGADKVTTTTPTPKNNNNNNKAVNCDLPAPQSQALPSRKSRQDAWKPAPIQTDQHYPPPPIQAPFCAIPNPPVTTPPPLFDGKIYPQERLTPTSTLVNGNNNNMRTTRIAFPTTTASSSTTASTAAVADRFLNQPGFSKGTSQQLSEQRVPSLWDIGNSNNNRPSYNSRRASTYSLEIQTGNHQALHPVSAMRRLSHGHDNHKTIHRNSDPFMSACSPWSPNLPDWSKYRAPHSHHPTPPSHQHQQQQQQEWTPPVSPWSADSKRSGSFTNTTSPSFSSSLSSDIIPSDHNSSTWEERFASILRVVDDDNANLTTTTSQLQHQHQQPFVNDNSWPLSPPLPPPPTSTTSNIDRDSKRHSASCNDTYPRNLWNNRIANTVGHDNHAITGNGSRGDDAKKLTAGSNGSSSDGMGLLVANSQLLQNMVQMGHLGCRHCGAGTHSTPRDCPYVPVMSCQDAWLQLLQAGHRCDTALFMEAIDVYSKARPNETFPSIARHLQDAGSTLQLVALDNNPLPSTTILVDLQGMMRRKYTVVAMVAPFSPITPSSYGFAASGGKDEYWNHQQQQQRYYGSSSGFERSIKSGMPESAEQNMARLAEAGLARDLTEMARCMLCKQSGHWAKDCAAHTTKPSTTYHPPPPPALSSSSFNQHQHQQQQQHFSRRHQSTGNIFNPMMNTMVPASSKDVAPSRTRRFNSFVSDISIFDTMTTTTGPPPLSKNTTASTGGTAAMRSPIAARSTV